jgi:hypothetical protein
MELLVYLIDCFRPRLNVAIKDEENNRFGDDIDQGETTPFMLTILDVHLTQRQ